MGYVRGCFFCVKVALRKESVDRNLSRLSKKNRPSVALRKESVDRNFCVVSLNYKEVLSLSARRAWIEIDAPSSAPYAELVALRKESVDRNDCFRQFLSQSFRRSPQGERG